MLAPSAPLSCSKKKDLNLSERHNTTSRENSGLTTPGYSQDAAMPSSDKLTYRTTLYQSVLFISLENNGRKNEVQAPKTPTTISYKEKGALR
jgi:hypothetical protein